MTNEVFSCCGILSELSITTTDTMIENRIIPSWPHPSHLHIVASVIHTVFSEEPPRERMMYIQQI